MPCAFRAVLLGQFLCTLLYHNRFLLSFLSTSTWIHLVADELLIPLVPHVASETSVFLHWSFNSPVLLYWFFFTFPLDLQRQHSPKAQLLVLFQATAERCSPLLKGNGEPSPALARAFRTGLPHPTAVILC